MCIARLFSVNKHRSRRAIIRRQIHPKGESSKNYVARDGVGLVPYAARKRDELKSQGDISIGIG